MYKCEKCEKVFKFNSLFIKHQNKKRTCMNNDDYLNKINDINIMIENKMKESLESNITCLFCNKDFLNKGNLSKHLRNNCSNIRELHDKKNKLKQIDEQIKSLIGPNDNNHIVMTSCGMSAKVLICELYKIYPNGIYLEGPPIKWKDAVFCKVDTTKTDMNDFYQWNEIEKQSDMFCWRTFYTFGDKSACDSWLPIPAQLEPYSCQDVFHVICQQEVI